MVFTFREKKYHRNEETLPVTVSPLFNNIEKTIDHWNESPVQSSYSSVNIVH